MKINDIINQTRDKIANNEIDDIDMAIGEVAKLANLDKDQVRNKLIKGAKCPKVKLQTKKEKEKLLANSVDIVASVISEEVMPTAAVAVINHNGKWLLGRSTACDGRCDKWTFPGGMIKNDEKPEEAACREAHEEMGVKCKPVREIARDTGGDVVFILCKAVGGRVRCNSEFADAKFFGGDEIRSLDTYDSCDILSKLL